MTHAAPKAPLLKWIGSKQRFASQIVSHFPASFGRYWEPFLGSGAVLAALAPKRAVGSDAYAPLMEIWVTLRREPELLEEWYASRWRRMRGGDKVAVYQAIKASFNARPNGADFLFLCRACYGGVIRFRRSDGAMSTPCGAHDPISPESFSRRVEAWHPRFAGVELRRADYLPAMEEARAGDLVYCDPPYAHSQRIVYGAQEFRLEGLIAAIERCRSRGVAVALSIDGSKRSGRTLCDLPIPRGLFRREVVISVGRSMLRRFQMRGRTLQEEGVTDRLLLTS